MRIPRTAGFIGFLIAGVAFYFLLPWALSILSLNMRLTLTSFTPWNLAGIPPILGGILLINWALSIHFVNAPSGWRFEMTPPYLLTTGPFRHTRNPMYLGGSLIWLGWTLFYASLVLLAAFLVFLAWSSLLQVPWEERLLEKRFGEEYLIYKRNVPRWLPRRIN